MLYALDSFCALSSPLLSKFPSLSATPLSWLSSIQSLFWRSLEVPENIWLVDIDGGSLSSMQISGLNINQPTSILLPCICENNTKPAAFYFCSRTPQDDVSRHNILLGLFDHIIITPNFKMYSQCLTGTYFLQKDTFLGIRSCKGDADLSTSQPVREQFLQNILNKHA